MRLQLVGIDEELHAQVLVDLRFALGLGQAAHRVDVVGLDAIEVVLGLGVLHAEDCVGVGLAVDVRDAPVVADDGDVGRLSFPARDLRGLGCVQQRERGGNKCEDEKKVPQATAVVHGLLFSIQDMTCLSCWLGIAGEHGGANSVPVPSES